MFPADLQSGTMSDMIALQTEANTRSNASIEASNNPSAVRVAATEKPQSNAHHLTTNFGDIAQKPENATGKTYTHQTQAHGSQVSLAGYNAVNRPRTGSSVESLGSSTIASGCPIKHADRTSVISSNFTSANDPSIKNDIADAPSKTGQFRSDFEKKNKSLYDTLRVECERIETNYQDAEREVLRRNDISFFMIRHEAELSSLAITQAAELKNFNEMFERTMLARKQRKENKHQSRNATRETKKRDFAIRKLELASNASLSLRKVAEDKRKGFDQLVKHMEETHDRERKQLVAAQDRKLLYDKKINDLETRHFPEEVRSMLLKQFQAKQAHQVILNKRINDQLIEIQGVEMRHAKERFDAEIDSNEELGNLQIGGKVRIAELETAQMTELQQEKEKLIGKVENDKLSVLTAQHQVELKRLQHGHRVAIRQLKMQQEQKINVRKHQKLGGKSAGSGGPVQVGSNMGSKHISRQNSNGSINDDNFSDVGGRLSFSNVSRKDLGLNSAVAFGRNGTASGGSDNMLSERDEFVTTDLNQSRNKFLDSINAVRNRHREEMNNLNALINQELNDATRAGEARIGELEEGQQLEIDKLRTDHAEEIRAMIEAQEKEIAMEQSVHEAEMHMMIERRVLNSVLDNVVDGIINITPKGTLTRFNAAAEKMFGYSANELIGKNIKMLMPERYSSNHDQYLKNYLTTGVKKVIGSGRRVVGLTKDGIEFPVQLSISEVKENDQHMFTGIVRNMTEEMRLEEEVRADSEAKKNELEKLVDQLAVSRKKADSLLSQMLPPTVSEQLLDGKSVVPQSFDSATVFFLDVVGFTTMCAKIQPMEAIDLLNAIYLTFDEVIEQYDAYKVETIGDSYMIVSGVPKKNGSRHAAEIATLALHILSKVHLFRYGKYPEMRLRVRIGLNTGPVVAGVVGTKMPRYCLFGDTVNTASRMESTGQPMKIQISETTHKLLVEAGGYRVTPRGETEVKGKGKMTTYFLTGKQDFPFELPPQ